MELDLGPEIAQFRAELRDWIAAEAPEALATLTDWNMPMTAGGRPRCPAGRGGGPPRLRRMGGQDGGQAADLPAVAGGVRRPGHGRGAPRRAQRGVRPRRRAARHSWHGRGPCRTVHHVHGTESSGPGSYPGSSTGPTSTPGLLRAGPGSDLASRPPAACGRRRSRDHWAEGLDVRTGPRPPCSACAAPTPAPQHRGLSYALVRFPTAPASSSGRSAAHRRRTSPRHSSPRREPRCPT